MLPWPNPLREKKKKILFEVHTKGHTCHIDPAGLSPARWSRRSSNTSQINDCVRAHVSHWMILHQRVSLSVFRAASKGGQDQRGWQTDRMRRKERREGKSGGEKWKNSRLFSVWEHLFYSEFPICPSSAIAPFQYLCTWTRCDFESRRQHRCCSFPQTITAESSHSASTERVFGKVSGDVSRGVKSQVSSQHHVTSINWMTIRYLLTSKANLIWLRSSRLI